MGKLLYIAPAPAYVSHALAQDARGERSHKKAKGMALPSKRLLRIYEHSPAFLQNILSSGFGVVKWLDERGGLFQRLYRELEEAQWWSVER